MVLLFPPRRPSRPGRRRSHGIFAPHTQLRVPSVLGGVGLGCRKPSHSLHLSDENARSLKRRSAGHRNVGGHSVARRRRNWCRRTRDLAPRWRRCSLVVKLPNRDKASSLVVRAGPIGRVFLKHTLLHIFFTYTLRGCTLVLTMTRSVAVVHLSQVFIQDMRLGK